VDGGEELREAGRLGARLKECVRVGTGRDPFGFYPNVET
jgi:hypothetical protein